MELTNNISKRKRSTCFFKINYEIFELCQNFFRWKMSHFQKSADIVSKIHKEFRIE